MNERIRHAAAHMIAGTVVCLWCLLQFCPERPYVGLTGLTVSAIIATWKLV